VFSISRIHQLIQPISRGQFDRRVSELCADRYVKRFGRWDQLVVMLYAQLSGSSSLRQVQTGFNAQRAHHYHLCTSEVQRTTLADANARRSPEIFADLARTLMAQVGGSTRRSCTQLLYLLDSSCISLKGPGFDVWTQATRTRNTQGIKLHLLLNAHSQSVHWLDMTAPNVNDCTQALQLPIEAGATYVFDKGYCDYHWWAQLHEKEALFVTRFKRNAALEVIEKLPLTEPAADDDAPPILSDERVQLAHGHSRGGRRPHPKLVLRRIELARPGRAPLVLASNDFTRSAGEIAGLYRQRWQVELYFKWIKQHLNIKRFLGRSQNAVRTQILVALIAHLLLALYRLAHGLKVSLWELLCEVRATLFQRPRAEAAAYERRRRYRQQMAGLQPRLFG